MKSRPSGGPRQQMIPWNWRCIAVVRQGAGGLTDSAPDAPIKGRDPWIPRKPPQDAAASGLGPCPHVTAAHCRLLPLFAHLCGNCACIYFFLVYHPPWNSSVAARRPRKFTQAAGTRLLEGVSVSPKTGRGFKVESSPGRMRLDGQPGRRQDGRETKAVFGGVQGPGGPGGAQGGQDAGGVGRAV